MRRAALLLAAAAAGLCAQGQSDREAILQAQFDAQKSGPTGSIHGVVHDEASGAPLAGIAVRGIRSFTQTLTGTVILGRLFSRTTATTDAQGRFALAELAAGTIVVEADGSRRGTVRRSVSLSKDQDLEVDLVLPTLPTLFGRVVDENKKPVSNVWVWLVQSEYRNGALHRDEIQPYVTEEDGKFLFDSGLEAGRTYYVLADRKPPKDVLMHPQPVQKRDAIEIPTYYGDAASLDAAAPLTLLTAEKRERVEIQLRKAIPYCAEGRLEVSGKPAAMPVIIQPAALAGPGRMVFPTFQSEADGTFRACGLPRGDYVASASVAEKRGSLGFSVAGSDVHGLLLDVDSVPLHLELVWDGDPPPATALPPAPSAGPEPMFKAPSMLRGPSRSEISVLLDALDNGSQVRKMEAAPYNGPFGAELAPADYAVAVELPPNSHVKQMTFGGVAVTDHVLHLAPAISGTLRIVATQGSGAITAKVSDADDNPLPDTTLVLVPDEITTVAQFALADRRRAADPSGVVAWTSLAPGRYRVLALDHNYKDTPEDLEKVLAALARAEVVEIGDQAHAEVTLHPVAF